LRRHRNYHEASRRILGIEMDIPSASQEPRVFYLDDLSPGQRFVSGSHTVDEAQIVAFARQFDPQPFHLNGEAGKQTLFGGLVASGWHTASLTMRLLVQGGAPVAGGIVGLGGEIKWLKPTRPGDTLQVYTEVVEVVPSRSRPDRGVVTLRSETRNQHGDVLQIFTANILVPRRAVEAGTLGSL
jgi:acyl dehydratase